MCEVVSYENYRYIMSVRTTSVLVIEIIRATDRKFVGARRAVYNVFARKVNRW